MLKRLLRRGSQPESAPVASGRRYQVVRSGSDLLSESGWRTAQVRQIKRLYSVTSEVWDTHYLYAIERFAELAQALPASEIHHHSRPGGLLDHTLEALLAGSRVAQGYMLPPNAEPEHLASNGDRWRFGAFVALLSHDLGKVVTDIEVVYRRSSKEEFQPWHPWSGLMPQGAEYAYRFRPRAENAGVAKSLHEKTAISLVPRLLTERATRWLWSDPELLAQFLSTVNHAPFGGGALSEIVRLADKASVGNDLGADTGVATAHSTATPLQEKLIIALRQMVVDGELRSNKPGAAVWVTESDTWVVSKKGGEALRDHLISEGHKGVPKSVLRIFNVLLDHDMVRPNPDGDPVWQARIEDHERDWKQKLSFLRFDNALLWATGDPRRFSGEVVALDASGNPVEDAEASETSLPVQDVGVEAEPASESVPVPDPVAEVAPEPGPEPVVDVAPEPEPAPELVSEPEPASATEPASEAQGESSPVPGDVVESRPVKERASAELDGNVRVRRTPAANAAPVFKVPTPTVDGAKENDFLGWLVREAGTRRVRVNEPEALVHVLDDYVAIASPKAFYVYLKNNPLRRKGYEAGHSGTRPFKVVQRELVALGIHKSVNGQNVAKVKISGAKSQSELSCILIHKSHLPFFKKFKPNKAVSL